MYACSESWSVWSNQTGKLLQLRFPKIDAGSDRKMSEYKVFATLCLLHMCLHSCRTVRVPTLTPINHDKLLVGSTVWSAQKPDESVGLTVLPALGAITSLFDQTPVKIYHWYIYLTALWITRLCLWASQCLGSSFFGLMCITIRLLEDFTDRRNVYTVI